MITETFNGWTLDKMGARAARVATSMFIEEHGYSWYETNSATGRRAIDELPITLIFDVCRDAAYDVVDGIGLDPDEFTLDVTDLALNELGV